jgi:uncharacterized iron-regulated membrane protein
MRDLLVRLHRWAGLATAVFLVATGLTGSVLAFQHEIDAWLNPRLFSATGAGPSLSPFALAAMAEAADPRIRVIGLPLRIEPGWSARLSVQAKPDPASGRRQAIYYDQVFLDPASGAVLGTRLSRAALIPVVHRFHFTLLDPTGFGRPLLGWVALAWTIDCFVGFVLTLPRRSPTLERWMMAWRLKTGGGAYRVVHDVHRAGGLWLWLVLFAVAVSSVYFNLQRELFQPAVSFFSPVAPSIFDERRPDPKRSAATLSLEAATQLGRDEARRRGWALEPGALFHHIAYGLYAVRFWPTQNDRGNGLGTPVLYLDDRDGKLLSAAVPGEGSAGDIVMQLQYPLHSGRIAGLPGRIAVSLSGVVVSVLAITGVVIWWTKRSWRRRMAARRGAR